MVLQRDPTDRYLPLMVFILFRKEYVCPKILQVHPLNSPFGAHSRSMLAEGGLKSLRSEDFRTTSHSFSESRSGPKRSLNTDFWNDLNSDERPPTEISEHRTRVGGRRYPGPRQLPPSFGWGIIHVLTWNCPCIDKSRRSLRHSSQQQTPGWDTPAFRLQLATKVCCVQCMPQSLYIFTVTSTGDANNDLRALSSGGTFVHETP